MALSNDKMKARHYLNLARGRRIISNMNKYWDANGIVTVASYSRQTNYKAKHRDLIFMATDGSI